jgi:hypothetical protein
MDATRAGYSTEPSPPPNIVARPRSPSVATNEEIHDSKTDLKTKTYPILAPLLAATTLEHSITTHNQTKREGHHLQPNDCP